MGWHNCAGLVEYAARNNLLNPSIVVLFAQILAEIASATTPLQ
ncbi:MAG TPA: hypothetical protein PLA27_01625 [Anaerolineales bacterium]|nr:hypothetical protein [Anaerolineales bacterium]